MNYEISPPALPRWLARMVPFRRYMAQTKAYRMHVMESGEGRPVLLAHGNPTWSFLYRKVIEELLGEPVRLIAPDLIGLGFSEKPTVAGAHQLVNHADWLGALIDELDLRDAILVGQDWGGPIGALAFARRPERLAGMVILNTVLSAPRPGFRPTLFHRFARAPVVSDAAFRLLGFPQTILWSAQGDKRSMSREAQRAYRLPLKGLRNNVAPLALARMVPDSLEHRSVPALNQVREFVENFKGPAAIVWGDRDPVLGSARNWIQKLLPHATMTRTNGGHFLQEEKPREIAAAILDVDRRLREKSQPSSA